MSLYINFDKNSYGKKEGASRQKTKVYELTISLKNTKPLVWRKVLAHDFIELNELHMLIQMSMGWTNSHLHSFDINGKTYSDDETAEEMNCMPTDGVELRHALGSTKKFTYTYDFGDDWLHDIEISNVLDHDSKMNYLSVLLVKMPVHLKIVEGIIVLKN